jgi:hypothetical protein
MEAADIDWTITPTHRQKINSGLKLSAIRVANNLPRKSFGRCKNPKAKMEFYAGQPTAQE